MVIIAQWGSALKTERKTHIVGMPIINVPLYASMNSLQEQLYEFLQEKNQE
jgi:hypothetical protein